MGCGGHKVYPADRQSENFGSMDSLPCGCYEKTLLKRDRKALYFGQHTCPGVHDVLLNVQNTDQPARFGTPVVEEPPLNASIFPAKSRDRCCCMMMRVSG